MVSGGVTASLTAGEACAQPELARNPHPCLPLPPRSWMGRFTFSGAHARGIQVAVDAWWGMGMGMGETSRGRDVCVRVKGKGEGEANNGMGRVVGWWRWRMGEAKAGGVL